MHCAPSRHPCAPDTVACLALQVEGEIQSRKPVAPRYLAWLPPNKLSMAQTAAHPSALLAPAAGCHCWSCCWPLYAPESPTLGFPKVSWFQRRGHWTGRQYDHKPAGTLFPEHLADHTAVSTCSTPSPYSKVVSQSPRTMRHSWLTKVPRLSLSLSAS